MLSLGIVHLLQGESQEAIECFKQIEQLVPEDSKLRLRAISFANLAAYQRFIFFPNGSGSSSLEIEARWNSVVYAENQEQFWNEQLRHVNDPSLLLESRMVFKMLSNLFPIRAYMDNLYIATPENTERLLKVALQEPLALRQYAETTGSSPELFTYIDRVIADIFWRAKQFDEAQQYLNQAFNAYSRINDQIGVATCWMTFGDWLAAPCSSPAVWNHLMQEGNGNNELSWARESVELYGNGINIAGAQNAYAEAEKLFSTAGSDRGLATLQLRYSYLAMLTHNYEDVIEHATLARQYYETIGDRFGYWLAQAHRIMGLLGTDKRTEDITTAEAIGDWGREKGSFSFSFGIGLMFAREGRRRLMLDGDYQRALSCCHLAQALFQRLDAINNVAQSQADQGTIYEIIGEQAAALTAYERAFDLFAEAIHKKPAIATAAWQQACMLGNKIYQIYLSLRNSDGMELSTGRLRSLFDNRPEPSGPDLFGANFPDSLREMIKFQEEHTKILAPLCRALAARDEDKHEESQLQFEQALSAADEVVTPQKDFLKAMVFNVWHRYPEAINAFQRYLDGLSSGFFAELAESMAKTFGQAGDILLKQQQEQNHEQAAMFFTRVKAYNEAKEHLDSLEQLAGTEWWNRAARPWEMLSLCGEIHAGLGNLNLALDFYNRAIANMEARRVLINRDQLKTALASSLGSQYLFYQAALIAFKLQKADLSFDYAEHGKARALLDLMSGSASLAQSPNTDSQSMRAWHRINAQLTLWHELSAFERSKAEPDKNRIEYLNQRIKTDEVELRRVETDLSTSIPNFHQLINPHGSTLSVGEISAILPPGTALLEYYFLEDDLLIWAITNKGLVSTYRASVDVQELKSQIRSFHRACENLEILNNQGIKLSEILLAPMNGVLKANSRIIIVPYGISHLLPFHALPWQDEALSTNHVISYLPSASTLQFLKPSGSGITPDSILAVGNPTNMSFKPLTDGKSVQLHNLPDAATEATYVASLFHNGKALIGDQATESEVRKQLHEYPIIHFATHGCLSEETPLLSGIMLADGESLNLYELMGLHLDADLVVLSACQTALGKTTGGDDVLGLTRGLLAAGANAAIVSLWTVNDASTCLLMGEFYRLIKDGNEPAVAMQNAQKYLRNLRCDEIRTELERFRDRIKAASANEAVQRHLTGVLNKVEMAGTQIKSMDYSHPFYWAPFIVVGRF